MNKQTAAIRASAFGLLVVWSELALAESTTIEPVEARVMAYPGNVTAAVQVGRTVQRSKSVSGRTKHEATECCGSAQQTQQPGRGSALRVATRLSESARIRENKENHVGATDRAAGARSGERSQSEVAEHRQERRGAESGSGAEAKGGSTDKGANAG